MRRLLLGLLPLCAIGGCRGYIADHVRPEESIMGPELTRYGLAEPQARCFGGGLNEALTVWQLRQLANTTRLIKDPIRLNPRDLVWVSTHVKDPKVGVEVKRAADACGLATTPAETTAAAPVVPEVPPPADAAPAPAPAPAAVARPAPATWLNLGSGTDQRTISIDASTLEGAAPVRRAWFKIVAAAAAGTTNSYLLQIDCTAKTVNPLATRKHGAGGAVVEEVVHGEAGAGANPIQGGSVIEIAYLSLCT